MTDTPNRNPARRIERADFMTLQDLERRLGLSPNATRDKVLEDGFPDPFAKVWRMELWRTGEVEAWCLEQTRRGVVYEPRR